MKKRTPYNGSRTNDPEKKVHILNIVELSKATRRFDLKWAKTVLNSQKYEWSAHRQQIFPSILVSSPARLKLQDENGKF